MAWSVVGFGKHRGKTLPQILFKDPDWFFWACDNDVFQAGSGLVHEAYILSKRARNIRIPGNPEAQLKARYYFYSIDYKFSRMEILPSGTPRHEGASYAVDKAVIDLSMPGIRAYDKLGHANLLQEVKPILFGQKVRVTKARCEQFFESESNFDIDGRRAGNVCPIEDT